MELKYDSAADAVYINLSSKPYAYGIDLDNERRVDYSEDGTPTGIELLCVSNGVNLIDLPHSEEMAESLQSEGFRTYFLEESPISGIGVTGMRLIYSDFKDESFNVYEEHRFGVVYNINLSPEPSKTAPSRIEVR